MSSVLTMDLYKILGLDKNASKDEIKKAYRILSLKHHPDKNQTKDTTLLFQSINDSYSILYDDNKRREYDLSFFKGHVQRAFRDTRRMVEDDISSYGFSYNTYNNNEEPIQRHHPRVTSHLPINIIKELEITIEQSYNGCDVPIEIVRWVYEGNIKKEERETLYVSIQRGIDDNEVIELKHKGNVLNDQTKGDVKIFIKVKNDTIFTRNGLDLRVKHNVTLKEALCGFSFNLTFINNKMFKINNGVGNIVTPGFKKIIKNMGMVRGEKTGSLIIEFIVGFPSQLTSGQIEEIERVFT